MVELFAVIGGLWVVWVVAKAATNSAKPEPEPPKPVLIRGRCPGCAADGQLIVLQTLGNRAVCIGCAQLHARECGLRPEWDHLPEGIIVAACPDCGAGPGPLTRPAKTGDFTIPGYVGWSCLECDQRFLSEAYEAMKRGE